jgi:hypothetical protein
MFEPLLFFAMELVSMVLLVISIYCSVLIAGAFLYSVFGMRHHVRDLERKLKEEHHV